MMPSIPLPDSAWLPLMAELAAKATLVLLLAAVATALLWRASAAVRHMVWCVAVMGVLALPLFSAFLPRWNLPLLPASPSAEAAADAVPAAPIATAEAVSPLAAPDVELPAAPAELPAAVPADGSWVARAALALTVGGMLIGLLWLAVGFWGVSRLGRRAEIVRNPEWLGTAHDAAERLGLRRPVLLLRSRGAAMPATWGLLWPSVILPSTADEWSDDRRRAVLAHELAHVKRFDCLTQAFAQAACVLFWWHPAVWYAAKRLRVERERACDDLVLAAGARASDYAAHLLDIARAHRSQRLAAPALVSMAKPSQLESRLLWVLDASRARSGASPRATALALLVGLLVVAPLAAMRPTEGAPAQMAANVASNDDGSPNPELDVDRDPAISLAVDADLPEQNAIAGLVPGAPMGATRGEDVRDRLKDSVRDGVREVVRDGAVGVGGGAGTGSARGARAPGDTFPSVDELIEMRAVGVTAQYISEMRAAGYGNVTRRELVSMRAVGVTPAYAAEMNNVGFGRLSAEDLTSLRALGVSAAYLAALRQHGIVPRNADEAAGLKAVGVTGEYAEEMRRAGFGRLDADALTDMRAVGVTPAYVRELAQHGITGLSADDVQGMRAVGVTGEYITGMKAAGLQGLDAETLTELRAVGVTGEYITAMRAAGLQGLNADNLTELRAVGVTPAYIRELASVGLTGLSRQQLTELRAHGVTAAYVRELRESGFADLSPNQLINLRASGVDRELRQNRGRRP